MSTPNHSGTHGAGYMARIAKLAPAAKPVKQLQVVRTKRHDIDDARNAVADKLLANLAYLRDPKNVERPDLVFKEQERGMYSVGIKYGNRWLNGVFDGNTYLRDVTAEVLPDVLQDFAAAARAGEFDQFIEPIMKANIEAKAKN
ncbi:hypothetical protein [Leptothrix discophora]|uniref:Uncharacterized protein n=1 Tax=Leptothrix discophora TaxID=89 RepID=A0ABT9G4E3_LEPDI|nr:hypothetical protein [Leptothrix discophora]MDP4301360.1 hypothetical protein [Leptothrix discophora]